VAGVSGRDLVEDGGHKLVVRDRQGMTASNCEPASAKLSARRLIRLLQQAVL